MSEQLTFGLDLDASSMIKSATKAASTLEQKFEQAGNNIRSELQKPIVVQAEFNLYGDPRKEYDRINESQKRVRDEQKKINQKARITKKLQDKITRALKGTASEKKAALKLVERLMKNTRLTKEEMNGLARAAKDLKKSLPKGSDMPDPGQVSGLQESFLKANVGATVLTRSIDALAAGLRNVVSVGVQMQTLNLQMEAFTGSATNAERAMTRFADIATRSPLDVMQVAKAGQIMMAFGVSSRDAAEATEMLAVAAAASGGDINLMSRNLGQIQAQQRAYTRDLTQFAIQGVPIWEELSNVTGASVADLKDMAKDGKIGMEAVSAALRNMTREGTAFAEVANRMQETYAGKLAKVESQFQTTAGKIIDSVSDIDTALGGVSSGFVDVVVNGLKQVEETFDDLSVIVQHFRMLVDDTGRNGGESFGQLEEIVGTRLRNSFLNLIPGVAAAKVGTDGFVGSIASARQWLDAQPAQAGFLDQAKELSITTTELSSKLQRLDALGGGDGIAQRFRNDARAAKELEYTLNDLIQAEMEAAGVGREEILAQIGVYEEMKIAAQDTLQAIEQGYADKAAAAQSSFEKEKSLDEEFIASKEDVISKLDEQIAKTRELGPAGRELEAIRRKELEYTARTGKELTGHVTEEKKKKLQAQASLERLDAQARAAELQRQKLAAQEQIKKRTELMEKKQEQHNEKMLRIEKEKKASMDAQNAIVDRLTTSIEALSGALQGDLVGGWDELEKLIGNAETKTGDVNSATAGYNATINVTISQLDQVNGRLDLMRHKILTMPKLPSGGSGDQPTTSNFAGGPIAAGTTSWVNELGKEAFLSASGRLSMINDTNGKWTAPSDGTIIPAHLTKQLNIPTGGINLNKTAGSRASVGGAMSVIKAAGGDTFNQSVTVQAANPTQAANNMMVEMTRLRRRRFR